LNMKHGKHMKTTMKRKQRSKFKILSDRGLNRILRKTVEKFAFALKVAHFKGLETAENRRENEDEEEKQRENAFRPLRLIHKKISLLEEILATSQWLTTNFYVKLF